MKTDSYISTVNLANHKEINQVCMCFSELAFAAVVFIALIIAAVILCIGVAFIRRFHLSLAFF